GARLTRPSGRGWRGRGRRAGGDEEARSRPRVEETAPLEMQISLNDGADADADVAAHRAQRRYALIRFQRAREDLPFDDVGDLLVSRAVSGGHPAPICISEKSRYLNLYHSASGALRCFRHLEDLPWRRCCRSPASRSRRRSHPARTI